MSRELGERSREEILNRYSINLKLETVVGIDIGGTNTVFAIIDKEGNIIAKDSLRTQDYKTIDLFVDDLRKKISSQSSSLNSQFSVQAIGIGAPNGNYYKGTIENATNLRWKGVIPFVDMLKKHLNLPAFITNDANAAAIGEMIYGSAKGMREFVVVTLGTGLGSGYVVNGGLVYGFTGFAGELGHVIIEPEGRSCGCGRRGCLETYVSATGITKTVIELLAKTNDVSLLSNLKPETLNSRLIYDAALQGDKTALDAFDITAKFLGRALADTVAITSPEAIFLFGGLAEAGEFILKPAEKYMNHYMLRHFKGSVKLLPSGVPQNNAAVLGAAALAWHENR